MMIFTVEDGCCDKMFTLPRAVQSLLPDHACSALMASSFWPDRQKQISGKHILKVPEHWRIIPHYISTSLPICQIDQTQMYIHTHTHTVTASQLSEANDRQLTRPAEGVHLRPVQIAITQNPNQ